MAMLDHLNVENKGGKMNKLKKHELIEIKAGATISGTLFNAIARGVTVFTDLGRYLGSAIRRMTSKSYCKL